MANSFEVIRSMRVVPITRDTLVRLVVTTLLPFVSIRWLVAVRLLRSPSAVIVACADQYGAIGSALRRSDALGCDKT